MKVLPAGGRCALVLVGTFLAISTAHAQNQDQNQNPIKGQNSGLTGIPTHPGGGPDPYAKYENDFNNVGKSPLEQEKLIAQLRQKQLTQATDLLLKVARDLRVEMAANPGGALTEDELQRLKLVEKLAQLIQDRERAQDQVGAALAKSGKGP